MNNFPPTSVAPLDGEAEWPRVPLGKVVDFVRGVSFDKSEVQQENQAGYVPILRAGNIRDTLDIHNDLIWVPPTCVSKEQFLRSGDLAICMSSGSAAVVGKTAQFRGSWHGSVGAFCGIIRPRPSVDPDFLGHWFRAGEYRSWRDRQARGANIQNLRFSQFAEIEIPLPLLKNQQRIAAELTNVLATVDNARRAAQERLAATEALPSAYLREVFEGPEASKWETHPLREVSKIVSGITLGRRIGLTDPRRVPYLRVANVKDGYLDLNDVYEIEASEAEIESLSLKRGDLLLTEGGDRDKLGRGTCWTEQFPVCLHQNHIFRVRFDSQQYCPEFVAFQTASSYGKRYFLRHAKQTTGIATINQGVLGSFPVLSPPRSSQKIIASALAGKIEAAQRVAEVIRNELEAVAALPAALLRKAFNGSD